MLMHKDNPNQQEVKRGSSATPQSKVKHVATNYLTTRPDDSPGLKKLKRLATLDSTELENFQKELKAEKEAQMVINVELKFMPMSLNHSSILRLCRFLLRNALGVIL